MENIYKKMAESATGTAAVAESASALDPARHIPPAVAHELNNILAIIRGYTDRLLVKHSQDPALEPYLKLISDAARRAGLVVREAMSPQSGPATKLNSTSPHQQSAA